MRHSILKLFYKFPVRIYYFVLYLHTTLTSFKHSLVYLFNSNFSDYTMGQGLESNLAFLLWHRSVWLTLVVCYLVVKSCPTLLWPPEPTRLLCPRDFLDKNTGMGCHFLLQEIFPSQELNPCLLFQQADSLPLSHQRNLWHILGTE